MANSEPEREPELLTHHEHNGTTNDYDDLREEDADLESAQEASDEPELDENGKKILTPEQRKKRRWKRIRRTIYALVGVFLVLPALAFTIMYFLVSVPTPEEVAAQQNQIVTYYYADGSEMGKDIPTGANRSTLKPNEIPDVVKHAVYAAEDASFESNPGFDIKGILGAVFNQLTGGTGGGSTISQQYIKKATANEAPTLTRKATELVKAFKMNNEQSKSDIITAYLNTIFFGRGAYGIQTASQAYFKKDVKDLKAPEAAFLAGLIQGPSRSDDTAYATKRWNYVMDQMVKNNWLSPTDRAAAQFPTTAPVDQTKPNTIKGPSLLIKQRVTAELEAHGIKEDTVQSAGFKIYTTIDPKAQNIAVNSVKDVMNGQPSTLQNALVAEDPKTGAVRAYYGGPGVVGDKADQDWANTMRNPGSSFKPFDLVALLERGKGLGETYEGRSGQSFGGSKPIANASVCSSPRCTVAEGMEKSVNSVFFDMVVNDTGVPAVIQAAKQAGIPAAHGDKPTMAQGDSNISIGGGATQVTAADMAGAYATFAANGVHRNQHFVSKVETAGGDLVYQADTNDTPAFGGGDAAKSKQIAGNVTDSLIPVVPYSHLDCSGGRVCAGKTGTHQAIGTGNEKDNAQAWMVGYTPSISVASWTGTGGGPSVVIRDAKGKPIYGSGLPGKIWQKFMNDYLKNSPLEKFDQVDPIGKPVPAAPPSTTESTTTTTTMDSPSTSNSSTSTTTTDNGGGIFDPPRTSRPTKTKPTTTGGLPGFPGE
jgi:membrane peptidoglycan carboxypeptidase